MCHPDVPAGQTTPAAARREVLIPLPGGAPMPAVLVGGEDRPAVMLATDIFGPSPFYEHLAARTAEAGFQVLLPDFFFHQEPLAERTREAAFARRAQLDETATLEELRTAVHWLTDRTNGAAVGTVGFCMGATFCLDLASTGEDVVTVAYYGFPVPKAAQPPPRPLDLVEALRGPVLAIWGDQDEAVGMDVVHDYVRRARAADPDFTAEVVAGLGHGFLGTADLDNPADPGGATWRRALAHLSAHAHAGEAG